MNNLQFVPLCYTKQPTVKCGIPEFRTESWMHFFLDEINAQIYLYYLYCQCDSYS